MDSIKLLVLEELWRKEPKSKVFLRLAEELRKSGQFERAIEVCKEGLPHQPGYVPALVSLGRSNEALGQNEEAERVFSQVLDLAPGNTHALRGMAHLLKERGAHDQAIGYLETLLLHEPNDAQSAEQLEVWRSMAASGEAAPRATATDDEVVVAIQEDATEEDVAEEEATDDAPEPEEALSLEDDASLVEAPPGEAPTPENDEKAQGPEAANPAMEDSLSNLDLEFEKALEETGEDADLFRESEALTGEFDVMSLSPTDQVDGKLAEEDLEAMITRGLKHEKMEHLERAESIYRELLERHPDDFLVREHHERVTNLLQSETPNVRKMRKLANWLDKIKGVYHVS